MVYDEKLNTWYKFTAPESDTYAICVKKVGSDINKIIISNGYQLRYYNVADYQDRGKTDYVQITATMRTKTFGFIDGISYCRLRRLWLNYFEPALLSGVSTTIKIYDTVSGTDVQYVRTTATGEKELLLITDAMTNGGSLKLARKLYFEISGIGFISFVALKFGYKAIRRGSQVGN